MRYSKAGENQSKWSSWRILWVLGLVVVIAAAGMIVSQQLWTTPARWGRIW